MQLMFENLRPLSLYLMWSMILIPICPGLITYRSSMNFKPAKHSLTWFMQKQSQCLALPGPIYSTIFTKKQSRLCYELLRYELSILLLPENPNHGIHNPTMNNLNMRFQFSYCQKSKAHHSQLNGLDSIMKHEFYTC